MKDMNSFVLQDENGLQYNANLLTILKIDGIEYAVYDIDSDSKNVDVYVSRIVKDLNGNDILEDIDDKIEKKKVFGIVNKMINES